METCSTGICIPDSRVCMGAQETGTFPLPILQAAGNGSTFLPFLFSSPFHEWVDPSTPGAAPPAEPTG